MLAATHISDHYLYSTWYGMRNRCRNPVDASKFARYGGRGIAVCKRWDDFLLFVADMGPRPAGYTLERIDNNLGYFPENCVWADAITQQNNKRNSVRLEFDGSNLTLRQWDRKLGLRVGTVASRLWDGMPLEKILAANDLKIRPLTFNGKTQSVKAWAVELAVRPTRLLNNRLARGWSVERALSTPFVKRRKSCL